MYSLILFYFKMTSGSLTAHYFLRHPRKRFWLMTLMRVLTWIHKYVLSQWTFIKKMSTYLHFIIQFQHRKYQFVTNKHICQASRDKSRSRIYGHRRSRLIVLFSSKLRYIVIIEMHSRDTVSDIYAKNENKWKWVKSFQSWWTKWRWYWEHHFERVYERNYFWHAPFLGNIVNTLYFVGIKLRGFV